MSGGQGGDEGVLARFPTRTTNCDHVPKRTGGWETWEELRTGGAGFGVSEGRDTLAWGGARERKPFELCAVGKDQVLKQNVPRFDDRPLLKIPEPEPVTIREVGEKDGRTTIGIKRLTVSRRD